SPASYFDELRSSYLSKRDLLVEELQRVGFGVTAPEGAYYVLADHTPFGFPDDVAFVDHLIAEIGVAAIPPSVFYHDSAEGRRLVRFAFCKDEAALLTAASRLERLRPAG